MTAPYDLDRQLDAFFLEGPTELPDVSFDAVRDRTEQTRQRVVLGPWRVPDMNKLIPIGLGAAAVVVALFVGARLLGPAPSDPDVGPSAAAVPSVQPSARSSPSLTPSPTPRPPASASPATPPLTQTFTSTVHGISLSYPEGWLVRAATEPWTDRPGVAQFVHPGFDVLRDQVHDDHLFLYIASQPIADHTPEEWVAQSMAASECPAAEPITVDGALGLIGADDCYKEVAVATGGRGYWIRLYTSPEIPVSAAPYDRAWFETVLATVQLQPEDAVE